MGSVVSDVMGVSALDMLRTIAAGVENLEKVSGVHSPNNEKKRAELELVLRGYINQHKRLMIKTILTHIDFQTD
ncbi:hypothetical protein QTL97_00825 [Sporosarcina thermotolerans]|uniref:Uncharacterized protein n=1 Tax=Sporosarcina thermotolerans TaxID=633404 RepID=A0AAW9A8J0_9BACL|nr:hypothetical protein [Sporosarcina thermotolerans]MDW0115481.1 hypothetical protein [Sporosarcina thermotolerans]WHT47192.1 hypothetical protein QNH10_13200 [Sporosarcina thermotolerans]